MSREDARAWLEELEMYGVRLGLDRVRALAAALGNPQDSYRTIHVVGTNGKSSTVRFIAAILQEYGYKVGTYTSPDLVSLAERQAINGVGMEEEDFYSLVERVRPVAAEVNAGLCDGEVLTQFEVLTALAFLHFHEQECDVAVVEAGLGGRWDATSIVDSEVQVLTNVGLEHTEVLGESVTAILEEKAAAIPEGKRVMSGVSQPECRRRLRDICDERGTELQLLDEDVSLLADAGQGTFDVFGLYGLYGGLQLSVLGHYQRSNAALALGAVELLLQKQLDVDKVSAGLARVRVPGRLEIISEQPLCILDGAHNPSGMAEMVKSLDSILNRRRVIGVVSILRDKGAEEMLRDLAPRCDILFVTQNTNPRSYPAHELAGVVAEIEKGPEVFVDTDPREALKSAYGLATSNQVILVTGSLFLIADLKRSLGV